MSISIRPLQEADIEGYHACLDVVARERRYLSMTAAPSFESSKAWILPHIHAGHPFYVASVESRVIGWCDITPMEREWFRHRGTLGMGVHPRHRRSGVGVALLTAAINHARSIKLERIELEVFSTNEAAIRLYEKVGFTPEETKRNACKSDGFYQDIVLMAYPL